MFVAPNEVVMYLVNAGLFKSALSLSTIFELSYEPIFEALTRQAILLNEYENPKAWNWLIENYLHGSL